MKQLQIPATYMRGGTSKGCFFAHEDLPAQAQRPGQFRDQLLLRIVGSPDPYAKHTDGMGGATSSTSKCVIVAKSARENHDVDYLFGQVSIDQPIVDWSGNCGNLSAAVGPFALAHGLLDAHKMPDNGVVEVRIWQVNTAKTIVAKVPVKDGLVQELGDFEMDGVTFPAAEIELAFLDPGADGMSVFPTGNCLDELSVPNVGRFQVTMINAGIPTVFLKADELGYTGTELQTDINGDAAALTRFETIRAHAAVAMGLIDSLDQAVGRQHTPKIAMVAPPKSYVASSGKRIDESSIDLNVRALSMGLLHHAMMGTAAVAISIAAAIPGSVVNQAAGGGRRDSVVFGHPSGLLKVGGRAVQADGVWTAEAALMSRSARVLMSGAVHVPPDLSKHTTG